MIQFDCVYKAFGDKTVVSAFTKTFDTGITPLQGPPAVVKLLFSGWQPDWKHRTPEQLRSAAQPLSHFRSRA